MQEVKDRKEENGFSKFKIINKHKYKFKLKKKKKKQLKYQIRIYYKNYIIYIIIYLQ